MPTQNARMERSDLFDGGGGGGGGLLGMGGAERNSVMVRVRKERFKMG